MIAKWLAAGSAALALATPAFAQDGATTGEWLTAYGILAGVAAIVVLLGVSAYNFERRRH